MLLHCAAKRNFLLYQYTQMCEMFICSDSFQFVQTLRHKELRGQLVLYFGFSKSVRVGANCYLWTDAETATLNILIRVGKAQSVQSKVCVLSP